MRRRRRNMNRVRRAAVISRLVERLRERDSWCGETHVQKAAYFLQELLGVPLNCDFVLYKHGPFSFDLRDELTSLRADSILALELQHPYGPRIAPTAQGEYIQRSCSKTLAKYDHRIAFVAEKMGSKNVVDLERLATALFVTQKAAGDATVDDRAAELTRLKAHIRRQYAVAAIRELDEIVEDMAGVQ